VFECLRALIIVPTQANSQTVSTLSSTLFGARDVDGLRQCMSNMLRLPLIVGFAGSVLLAVLNVPVLAAFGVTDPDMVSSMFGAFLWLIPIGLFSILSDGMANYYSASEHTALATVLLVGGDSVIYLLCFIALVPSLGLQTAWIAYLVSDVILMLVMMLIYHFAFHKRIPYSADDIMLLPNEFYDEKDLLNISLGKADRDLNVVPGVRRFVGSLGFSDKIAFRCALCVEELTTRAMSGNPQDVDIRLFMLDGNLHISIRDDGKASNHLAFDPVDEFDGVGIRIVREMAKSVEYNYMAGFNVLSVELNESNDRIN